jgi:hypothetical protein
LIPLSTYLPLVLLGAYHYLEVQSADRFPLFC